MSRENPAWTVRRFMTDVPLAIRPDTKLASAFLKMRIGRFRHLPVVDAGRLVGMVTDRDLHRRQAGEHTPWRELYDVDDERPVSDVMTREVRTVAPDAPLLEAVETFVEHGYGALPVLDEKGTLVGILSAYDALRALRDALRSGDLA